jgi:hypothetical protein
MWIVALCMKQKHAKLSGANKASIWICKLIPISPNLTHCMCLNWFPIGYSQLQRIEDGVLRQYFLISECLLSSCCPKPAGPGNTLKSLSDWAGKVVSCISPATWVHVVTLWEQALYLFPFEFWRLCFMISGIVERNWGSYQLPWTKVLFLHASLKQTIASGLW